MQDKYRSLNGRRNKENSPYMDLSLSHQKCIQADKYWFELLFKASNEGHLHFFLSSIGLTSKTAAVCVAKMLDTNMQLAPWKSDKSIYE